MSAKNQYLILECILFVVRGRNGNATKDNNGNALQAYESYIDKIKSDDRNKAAASAIDGPAVLIVDVIV